jgi:alkylation response protein AidB-like acyl-CoA dehydrogenase
VNRVTLGCSPRVDELELLRQSARKALNRLYAGSPDEKWTGSWPANWHRLEEQGFWSTIEPPEGSLAAAAVVVEELGRVLYPGPGCEALAGAYVTNGLRIQAVLTSQSGPGVVFVNAGDPLVQPAPETLVVVAEADELFAARAADMESHAVPSLDVTRRLMRLRFGKPPTDITTPDLGLAGYGRCAKALLYCADTLGCVERVLCKTGEYAMERKTFGSPIGKYQAVAHRLVDHAITTQQMRLLLDSAIAAFDARGHDVALRVAIAETFFYGRSAEIISDCIQLVGAIGFTWEFGHHFYLRRVVQNGSLGSGPGRPHQRLAAEAQW